MQRGDQRAAEHAGYRAEEALSPEAVQAHRHPAEHRAEHFRQRNHRHVESEHGA